MKVLITGATGYIGSHTTAAVLRAGHQVRLLVRDRSRVRGALTPLGVDPETVEVVSGDVTHVPSVRAAVRGVDAVIHLASVFSMDSREFGRMRRVNVPGTKNVLEEAHQAGADPIVYGSSYGAMMPAMEPLTANSPVGQGKKRPPYIVAQADAERIARQLQDEGAPVVIVNLLTTLGPHDPHLGDQLTRVRNAILGRLKFMPSGGLTINDVRDAAALLSATLISQMGARQFFPAGYHVSMREYMEAIERAIGRSLHTLYVPARSVLPLCRATDVLQHLVPWHIPTEYTAAYICRCDALIDSATPTAPLGIAARPLSDTFADSVRWLYDQGHITAQQAGTAGLTAAAPRD